MFHYENNCPDDTRHWCGLDHKALYRLRFESRPMIPAIDRKGYTAENLKKHLTIILKSIH